MRTLAHGTAKADSLTPCPNALNPHCLCSLSARLTVRDSQLDIQDGVDACAAALQRIVAEVADAEAE